MLLKIRATIPKRGCDRASNTAIETTFSGRGFGLVAGLITAEQAGSNPTKVIKSRRGCDCLNEFSGAWGHGERINSCYKPAALVLGSLTMMEDATCTQLL